MLHPIFGNYHGYVPSPFYTRSYPQYLYQVTTPNDRFFETRV